jgi:uncharacterized membrane protein YeaQ/YmgE (transglycosylase-associated protein family)
MTDLIISLIVSGLAGFLAGLIRKGQGYGIIGNILVGIAGGWIGSWLFGVFNISSYFGANGFFGQIFVSVIGALVLLFILGLFFK